MRQLISRLRQMGFFSIVCAFRHLAVGPCGRLIFSPRSSEIVVLGPYDSSSSPTSILQSAGVAKLRVSGRFPVFIITPAPPSEHLSIQGYTAPSPTCLPIKLSYSNLIDITLTAYEFLVLPRGALTNFAGNLACDVNSIKVRRLRYRGT